MSKQPSPPPPAWRHWLWPIALLAMLALFFLLPSGTETLTYSQFISQASKHQIKTAIIGSASNGSNPNITGTEKNGKNFTTVGPPDTSALAATLRAEGTSVSYAQPSPALGTELLYFLILLPPLLLVIYFYRRRRRAR